MAITLKLNFLVLSKSCHDCGIIREECTCYICKDSVSTSLRLVIVCQEYRVAQYSRSRTGDVQIRQSDNHKCRTFRFVFTTEGNVLKWLSTNHNRFLEGRPSLQRFNDNILPSSNLAVADNFCLLEISQGIRLFGIWRAEYTTVSGPNTSELH